MSGPTTVGVLVVTAASSSDLNADSGILYIDENLYDSEPGQPILTYTDEVDPAFNEVCPNTPQTEEETKKQVAAMAAQIAREIGMKLDWNQREYTAVIYRGADGRIYRTPLQAGELMAVNIQPTAALSTVGLDGSLGYSQVLGTVHNHPYEYTNGTLTTAETRESARRPSSATSSQPYGDFATADFLVGQHPDSVTDPQHSADPDLFSMFIIDDVFTMRAYRYNDLRLPSGAPNQALGPVVDINQPICGTGS